MLDRDEEILLWLSIQEGVQSLDIVKRLLFVTVEQKVPSVVVKKKKVINEQFLEGLFLSHYDTIMSGLKAENKLTQSGERNSLRNMLRAECVNMPITGQLLEYDEISWLDVLNIAKSQSLFLREKIRSAYGKKDVGHVSLGEIALKKLEKHFKGDEVLGDLERENLIYQLQRGREEEAVLDDKSQNDAVKLKVQFEGSETYKALKLEEENEIKKAHENLLLELDSLNLSESLEENAIKRARDEVLQRHYFVMEELKEKYAKMDDVNTSLEDSVLLSHNYSEAVVEKLEDNLTETPRVSLLEETYGEMSNSDLQRGFNELIDVSSFLDEASFIEISIIIGLDNNKPEEEKIGIEAKFKQYVYGHSLNKSMSQISGEMEEIEKRRASLGPLHAFHVYDEVLKPMLKIHQEVKSLSNHIASISRADKPLKYQNLRKLYDEDYFVLRSAQLFDAVVNSDATWKGWISFLNTELTKLELEKSKRNDLLENPPLIPKINLLFEKSQDNKLPDNTRGLYNNAHNLTSDINIKLGVLYDAYKSFSVSEDEFALQFKKIVDWEGECQMHKVSVKEITLDILLDKPHGYVFNTNDNKLYYLNKYELPPIKPIKQFEESNNFLSSFGEFQTATTFNLSTLHLQTIKDATQHSPSTPSSILGQHRALGKVRAYLVSLISDVCRLMNCPELAEKFAPNTKKKLNELRKAGQEVIEKVKGVTPNLKA